VKVTAVSVTTLELAYDEPFVIASSALAAGPCDLVRLETDEGLTGYGEACPGYEFTGETLWTVEDVIEEYLGPAVVGRDPFAVDDVLRAWERELWTVGNQAARGALEMALWDLQGKALGRPLADLLGGAGRDALPEVLALGWAEPEALAAKVRVMAAAGVTVFKIKVGDAIERDEARGGGGRPAGGPPPPPPRHRSRCARARSTNVMLGGARSHPLARLECRPNGLGQRRRDGAARCSSELGDRPGDKTFLRISAKERLRPAANSARARFTSARNSGCMLSASDSRSTFFKGTSAATARRPRVTTTISRFSDRA